MSIVFSRHPAHAGLTVLAVVLIFTLGNYVFNLQGLARYWFVDLAWTLASLATGLACLDVARKLDGADQRAWRFYGYGCLAWFAGMLIWSYYELIGKQATPFPALSDVGFLGFAPLFLLGLMNEFTRMSGKRLTLKNFSDIGLIGCAVTMACLIGFNSEVLGTQHNLMYLFTALSFPVLYISIFIYALLTLSQHADKPDRNVLLLLLGSLALHAFLSILYANSLFNKTYQTGNFLDVFWIIAFGLIYLAAMQKLRIHADSRTVARFDLSSERVRSIEILILGVTALTICIIAIIFYDQIRQELLKLLVPLVVLAIFFVSLREWAIFRLERQLNAELKRSEAELSKILDSLQDTFFRTDLVGTLHMLSPSITQLSGYKADELLGKRITDTLLDRQDFQHLSEQIRQHGHLHNLEIPIRHKDGNTLWVAINAQYYFAAANLPLGIEGTIRNITGRKLAEAEMDKLSRALTQTADIVMITDRTGIVEYINPAFTQVTGYTSSEVIGRKANLLKSGRQSGDFYRQLWQTLLAGEAFSDVFINQRSDGTCYYESKTITPVMDKTGAITHFISTGKDISEQMQTQERLNFMAHHDVLTELPNRALFLDRVKQALARARWHKRRLAIMFMDIDSFKYINDSLGHEVGDQLLISIARRLHDNLRDGDTIARFGGDEFVIMLDDIARETDVTAMAHKLLEALRPTFDINGMALHITASIGISLYPADGDEAQTLLRNADNAMYRAKESGKNTYKFFSNDMSVRAFERLTLENSLRQALKRHEFLLHYQPLLQVATSQIIGVEALLRWKHPDLGLLAPNDFIPILEETGLIVPVGEWILEQACTDLQQLQENSTDEFIMSVNISARQINDPGFDVLLGRVIRQSNISGTWLQLEMTESTLMRYTADVIKTLGKIRQHGISIALDDFGTGYSSLSYLKRFPIDTLKIDRSFIRDVISNPDDAALTTAIIAMAKSLNLKVIAEGVENLQQLTFLQQHACTAIQGYLVSKPGPLDEIARFMAGYPDTADWPWLPGKKRLN